MKFPKKNFSRKSNRRSSNDQRKSGENVEVLKGLVNDVSSDINDNTKKKIKSLKDRFENTKLYKYYDYIKKRSETRRKYCIGNHSTTECKSKLDALKKQYEFKENTSKFLSGVKNFFSRSKRGGTRKNKKKTKKKKKKKYYKK